MFSVLERRRRSLDDADTPEWKRRYFSPVSAGLYSALLPRLQRAARGRVLDVGCGAMPFKRRLTRLREVTGYDSLDVEARVPGVTFVASVDQMTPVPSSSYDTVLCSEVLEHVANPWSGLREIHRVLRAGGHLILTVPFLARLHEEPRDYFRYTEHSLREMLQALDFEVQDIVTTGSVAGFLGHQISSVLVPGTLGVPGVEQVAFLINAAFVVLPCVLIDRLWPARRKFPLGYIVVARRR
jgi:SAM-dependent methyltransferase